MVCPQLYLIICYFLLFQFVKTETEYSQNILRSLRISQYFVDDCAQIVFGDVGQVNQSPVALLFDQFDVGELVREKRHANHRDRVVRGLFDAVQTAVSDEQFNIRMACRS